MGKKEKRYIVVRAFSCHGMGFHYDKEGLAAKGWEPLDENWDEIAKVFKTVKEPIPVLNDVDRELAGIMGDIFLDSCDMGHPYYDTSYYTLEELFER